MSEELIDVYTAAEELGFSRMTLYRLMKQYGIKRYKIPGRRRMMLRRGDLDALREPREWDEARGSKAAA